MSAVRPLYLPMTYQDAADHGRLILRDGSAATIRLSQRDDLADVRAFYARLSPQSRRMRFFSECKPGEDVMMTLCDSSDPRRGMTLLVWRFADGAQRIIASGSYIAHNQTTAEFAVAVDDTFQGKGLGGLIFERLSVLAASHGFLNFCAFTHNSNHQMLEVFRHSGFHLREQFQDGVAEVHLSLMPGAESVRHAERRDRLFTKASIRPFFRPRSVAVIGASRDPQHVGHRLFMTLLRQQFHGVVYPVNPQATQVSGVKAYPTAEDLPEAVDLAVIAVPGEEVEGVVDRCARRGVRALIVISTGFAETGAEGKRRELALLEKVRGYGMRMLGPNCLGLINTDPDIRLNASMSGDFPERGKVAISSQSGALGMALLQLARKRRLGISMFVSMGNKADVTGNDLLYYWEDDPATGVILLYLESFGNPRRFGRIAREVSRHKPIVCVKSGRHGGTSEEHAVQALFQQAGVIRMQTLEEMFDVAALLGTQPLPAGNGVAIITNSHGAGTLCHDACTAEGLKTAGFRDLSSEASPGHYRQALTEALADEHIHSIILLFIPVTPSPTGELLDQICSSLDESPVNKPVLLVMMTGETTSGILHHRNRQLPCYLFPEAAAHALADSHRYSAWRQQPPGLIPDFDEVDVPKIRRLIELACRDSVTGELPKDVAEQVLREVGIRTAVGAEMVEATSVELDVHPDRVFGPVMSFSLAGYHRDVLGDVTYRMVPLTDLDAQSMVASIRGYPLLESASADLAALQDLILRLSFLMEELPEIESVRLSPVFVQRHTHGCFIGNTLIHVSVHS